MGWRWVFYVGIVPALLLVFIRRGMVEPEHFAGGARAAAGARRGGGARHSDEDQEFMRFVPLQLFNRAEPLQHAGRAAVLRRHAARDLDQQHLAADDPAQHPRRRRHPGQRRDPLYQLRHDDVGARRHLRLCRVRLYRRRDRPPADDPALQCRRHCWSGCISIWRSTPSRHTPTCCSCSGSSCSACSRGMRSICPSCSRRMCGRPRCRSATAPAGSSPASARCSPGCWSASSTSAYATAAVMTCFALLSILAMALGRETRYDELPR